MANRLLRSTLILALAYFTPVLGEFGVNGVQAAAEEGATDPDEAAADEAEKPSVAVELGSAQRRQVTVMSVGFASAVDADPEAMLDPRSLTECRVRLPGRSAPP